MDAVTRPADGAMQGRKAAPRYRFVDFAARAQPGFRNHLVTVDEVAALVERYAAYECYASVFRFSADVLVYAAEEEHGAGRSSLAGYDGRVWAPFLPIDIDAHPPDRLGDALELARRVHDLLVGRWQVPDAAVHAYFSGAKGFHLLLDTRALGRVIPSRDLHRAFTRVRLELLQMLPDSARPLFDLALGDKLRLLRLANTRHAGSGLFKIPLSADELQHGPVAEILALARAPRPLSGLAAAGLEPLASVAPVPALVERFERARSALRRERGPHPYRFAVPPARVEDALCAARRTLWSGDVGPGNRNNVAIRLASAFRLAGYAKPHTRDLMAQWIRRQTRPLAAAEIEAIVHSAYAHPYPYAFGCGDAVIRSVCPYAGRRDDCLDDRRGRSWSPRRPPESAWTPARP
jgi:hypothetical protein